MIASLFPAWPAGFHFFFQLPSLPALSKRPRPAAWASTDLATRTSTPAHIVLCLAFRPDPPRRLGPRDASRHERSRTFPRRGDVVRLCSRGAFFRGLSPTTTVPLLARARSRYRHGRVPVVHARQQRRAPRAADLASSRPSNSRPRRSAVASSAPALCSRERLPHLDDVDEQRDGDSDPELFAAGAVPPAASARTLEPPSPSSPSSLAPSPTITAFPVPSPASQTTKPRRAMKPPSFPAFTAEPDALSIAGWLKLCENAVVGWKAMNPDAELATKTVILYAGGALQHRALAEWWMLYCDELVKLPSFEQFGARIRDEFLDANWRYDALVAFYLITQGSDSFKVFANRLKSARTMLKAAGGEFTIDETIFKNHLLIFSHPLLRLSVLAINGFDLHASKVKTLMATMSKQWDILVAAGKLNHPPRSAPSTALAASTTEPATTSSVGSASRPLSEAQHAARRAELQNAGGCFCCGLKPGDPGWTEHQASTCPTRARPGVNAVVSCFHKPDDSADEEDEHLFVPGHPAPPRAVAAVVMQSDADLFRWDSETDDDD
uniref:Retrotransposon gag domain-containing protein n=1 Tax=Mycena chlorophos TaxID=658473 RepID=A0ABQ0L2P9_MYCCL|nr:predicted protein [Mycena chlorophos]